jgi:hypothetical protein
MKENILAYHKRQLYSATQNNKIRSINRGGPGVHTNNLLISASVLPISASVQEAPPVSYIKYDEVSCLTFTSSINESNEECNEKNR